jgi:hypothetical protein
LDTWRLSDWAIKAYGIATDAPDHKWILDPQLIEAARSFVEANMARMSGTRHYSAGFAIHASWERRKITPDPLVGQ